MPQRITKELFEQVDWNALKAEIERGLGITIEELKVVHDDRGWIRVESSELVEHAGMFKTAFRSVVVANFGGNCVLKREELTYDSEDFEPFLWLPIHFRWEMINYGQNGGYIFDATWLFDKGEWQFSARKPRS